MPRSSVVCWASGTYLISRLSGKFVSGLSCVILNIFSDKREFSIYLCVMQMMRLI